jgi:hypothetical protein
MLATARDAAGTINKKLAAATNDRASKLMQEAAQAATLYQATLAETANTMKMLQDCCSRFAHALNQVQFLYLDTPRRAGLHDGRR